MSDIATLTSMLEYCRPAGSVTETAFCERFIVPTGAFRDTFGNWHLTHCQGESRILWSCHTDTVANMDGYQTIRNRHGVLSLSRKSRKRDKRNCLGGDNTAGVWLLLQMIAANVPGYYVFHAEEEIGGRGSQALADKHFDWLAETFTHAIAFDRRGTADVITHQGWSRTASDKAGQQIASLLNAHGLHYAPSEHGIFTDTANYAHDIPECTNISAGTSHEHQSSESLDTNHLFALRDAVCAIDWAQLVAHRDPKAIDDDYWGYMLQPSILPRISPRSNLGTVKHWVDVDKCADCGLLYDTCNHVKCPDCGGLRLVYSDTPLYTRMTDDDDPVDESIYLDSDFALVQAALRRQA